MTMIARFDRGGSPGVGVLEETALHPIAVDSVGALLELPLEQVRSLVEDAREAPALEHTDRRLLSPVDGLTEVWASGVTYERSLDARVEESATQDVYESVYRAERPELFFKAPAWRVVPDGMPVAVRADSAQNVPEPELVLVLNSFGEIIGYSVGNDMSSRDIEGANPLYLPQAKVYDGSFSLATGIRPVWEVPEVLDLDIEMTVLRAGVVAWQGSTSTKRLARPLEDLVEHLFRCYSLPQGAVLCTGTGIVPEIGFTARPGDEVRIEIESVGVLANPVVETGTAGPAGTATQGVG